MTLSHGVLRPGAEWSPPLVSGEPAGLCIPPSGARLPTGRRMRSSPAVQVKGRAWEAMGSRARGDAPVPVTTRHSRVLARIIHGPAGSDVSSALRKLEPQCRYRMSC